MISNTYKILIQKKILYKCSEVSFTPNVWTQGKMGWCNNSLCTYRKGSSIKYVCKDKGDWGEYIPPSNDCTSRRVKGVLTEVEGVRTGEIFVDAIFGRPLSCSCKEKRYFWFRWSTHGKADLIACLNFFLVVATDETGYWLVVNLRR